MSHTIRKVNLGNTALVSVTIVDYVQGGEAFTLAELGLTGALASAIFLLPVNSPYSLSLSGNKVVLSLSSTSTLQWLVGTEQSTQSGINFNFSAIINGT